jgi:hypothetical protein
MRKENRFAPRVMVALLCASAGFAQAGTATKGDATLVAPLGGSGYFNPGTETLPKQCRTMPNITTTEACPSGTTGSIKKSSYYYCPTGAEPGLYSAPTVSDYGCVPIEQPATGGGGGATGLDQCVISTLNGTRTYQVKYEGGYKAREVDFNRNTGGTSETEWAAVSVPSSGARIGSGTLIFDTTIFRASSFISAGVQQHCQGSMPLPPPPTQNECSFSSGGISYVFQVRKVGTDYSARLIRNSSIGAWMSLAVPGSVSLSGGAVSATSTTFTGRESGVEWIPRTCSNSLP